ncbi:hypothetical protein [Vagococcus zengguangii]|uniref:Uncharacterized protein n=1 Tax=Vagococcus zengguangii TaxID=2571750 RepID=A0A4D7CUY6_9ENTE|nr:hypothetical protein [Vagococcus zengguangii]QCI87223.1 hypothetical protein FA707_09905 [Vagococcus zengguangii]TLG80727.1 hypothetical protein FE258_04520 [Vagococcus zengguangii]
MKKRVKFLAIFTLVMLLSACSQDATSKADLKKELNLAYSLKERQYMTLNTAQLIIDLDRDEVYWISQYQEKNEKTAAGYTITDKKTTLTNVKIKNTDEELTITGKNGNKEETLSFKKIENNRLEDSDGNILGP